MRRFAGIAAVLFLLLLPLAACGGAEEKAGFDPEITLQALADAGAFSEELEELDGDTAFTLYGLGNSGLEREDLTAAKVLRSAGATCEEGAVLVFTSGDQAQTAVQVLGDYVQKQIDSNRDYRPQELPKLESAAIQQRENNVLLLVAGDLEAAQGVLEQ